MCKFESSLIAWMDGELDAAAALEVEQHLPACENCAACAAQYREVSQAFAAHYLAAPIQSNAPRWRRLAFGAAAVLTAAAATVLWMLRPLPEPLPIERPKIAEPPAMALKAVPADGPALIKAVHHEAATKPAEIPTPWTSVGHSIEIVMPADAMLAPGAVPAGVTFAADLSISGDGSPEALRVQPRLYLK